MPRWISIPFYVQEIPVLIVRPKTSNWHRHYS
jgi:hypothetical protein